jgi:type VI secretion system protein VasG
VASVVADWTGIPVGRMVRNEIETVLDARGTLGKRSSARTTRWT